MDDLADSRRVNLKAPFVDNYPAVPLSDHRCIQACIEKKVQLEEQHTDVWSEWHSGARCAGDESKYFSRTYQLPHGYETYLVYDAKTEDDGGRSWVNRIAPDRKSVEITTSCPRALAWRYVGFTAVAALQRRTTPGKGGNLSCARGFQISPSSAESRRTFTLICGSSSKGVCETSTTPCFLWHLGFT